jgi:hypothetical protein
MDKVSRKNSRAVLMLNQYQNINCELLNKDILAEEVVLVLRFKKKKEIMWP